MESTIPPFPLSKRHGRTELSTKSWRTRYAGHPVRRMLFIYHSKESIASSSLLRYPELVSTAISDCSSSVILTSMKGARG